MQGFSFTFPGCILCIGGCMESRKVVSLPDIREAMHFIAAAVTSYFAFPFGEINYEMIAEDLRELAGADFVVFNVTGSDGTYTVTRAAAGLSEDSIQSAETSVFPLIGERWSVQKVRGNSHLRRRLVRLDETADDTYNTSIPRRTLKQLSAMVGRDHPYCIGIHYDGSCLGDFLIFMLPGADIPDPEPVELFVNQISTLLLRKQTEEYLQQVNREYETVFQGSHDAIMLIGIADYGALRCQRINQAFESVTGISAEQVSGKSLQEILGEEFGSNLEAMCRKSAESRESTSFEQELIIGGRSAVFHTVLNPVIFSGRAVQIIASSRNITEQKRKEAQILHLSIHDPLTGFCNRSRYFESLKACSSPDDLPLSVIIADVNGLKLVNDAFGHALGDRLIQHAADLLAYGSSPHDHYFRIGGDEFALLLPRTDQNTAVRRMDAIRRKAQFTAVGPVQVSLALGSCTRTSADQSLDSILQQAESAMYTAKLSESRAFRSNALKQLMRKLQSSTEEHARHTETVRRLAVRLGSLLGLSGMDLDALGLLGIYHDIGKISVDPEVLNKPGSLEYEERVIIRRHCEVGYRIAATIQEISSIAEDILSHHERWDGSGYPQGLSGPDIPLRARIIALCDAYTVMIQGTYHQRAVSHEEALDQIRMLSGRHFDPELASLFISMSG